MIRKHTFPYSYNTSLQPREVRPRSLRSNSSTIARRIASLLSSRANLLSSLLLRAGRPNFNSKNSSKKPHSTLDIHTSNCGLLLWRCRCHKAHRHDNLNLKRINFSQIQLGTILSLNDLTMLSSNRLDSTFTRAK